MSALETSLGSLHFKISLWCNLPSYSPTRCAVCREFSVSESWLRGCSSLFKPSLLVTLAFICFWWVAGSGKHSFLYCGPELAQLLSALFCPEPTFPRKAKPHSSLCLQSYKPSRRQTVDSPSWNLGGPMFREDKPTICGFIHLFCPWEAGCWEPCSLSLCHCHCVCCNHRAGDSHRLHVTQRHIHCKRSSHVRLSSAREEKA